MAPLHTAAAAVILALLSAASIVRSSVYENEITLYTDVVRRSPEKSRPHNNLGDALIKAHRYDEAEAHIRRALDLWPDYPDALNNLATVHIHHRRNEEALVLLLRALELKPDHAEARFNLAVGLYQRGMVAEAEQHFRFLLDQAPDSSYAGFAATMLGMIRGSAPP